MDNSHGKWNINEHQLKNFVKGTNLKVQLGSKQMTQEHPNQRINLSFEKVLCVRYPCPPSFRFPEANVDLVFAYN